MIPVVQQPPLGIHNVGGPQHAGELGQLRGWNVTGPKPSQRRAPLTSTPSGVSTSTRSTRVSRKAGQLSLRSTRTGKRDNTSMAATPKPAATACVVNRRYGEDRVLTPDADSTMTRPMTVSSKVIPMIIWASWRLAREIRAGEAAACLLIGAPLPGHGASGSPCRSEGSSGHCQTLPQPAAKVKYA